MEEKALQKEAFFNELFQLDDKEENEPVDSYDVASLLRQCKARDTSHVSPLPPSVKGIFLRSIKASTPLARTTSAPLPSLKTPLPAQVDIVYQTPPVATTTLRRALESIGRITSGPRPNGSRQGADGSVEMPKAIKKRKRGRSLDMMPDSQQIFKGLGFCMQL